MKINLLGISKGQGHQKDIAILKSVLEHSEHEVTVNDVEAKPFYFKWSQKKEYDLNIFMEKINPLWLPAAKVNSLIPNQESFFIASGEKEVEQLFEKRKALLDHIDLVLCKTHYAEKIFKGLGKRCLYVSFTSPDHGLNREDKKKQFLHLAGESLFKGTTEVIHCWEQRKDLPPMFMGINPKRQFFCRALNIHMLAQFFTLEELKELQNRSLFHVAPSRTEGFGHTLMEAMSTSAIVLTTDAPPMNELVTENRGILIPYTSQMPVGLGAMFCVSPEEIAKAVEKALNLTDNEIACKQKNARAFYEENDRFFKKTFLELCTSIS